MLRPRPRIAKRPAGCDSASPDTAWIRRFASAFSTEVATNRRTTTTAVTALMMMIMRGWWLVCLIGCNYAREMNQDRATLKFCASMSGMLLRSNSPLHASIQETMQVCLKIVVIKEEKTGEFLMQTKLTNAHSHRFERRRWTITAA